MSNEHENNLSLERKVIDLAIKLILILLLIGWSGMILFPFTILLLWAAILATTIFPLYKRLLNLLKGKKRKMIGSSLITILLLCILLIPTIIMISSIVDEASELKTS